MLNDFTQSTVAKMKQNRYNYSLIMGLDTYSPKTSLWRLAVPQGDCSIKPYMTASRGGEKKGDNL